MDCFDKIIGYREEKKELRQIADTLKNREYYEKLGINMPRGLLLYGPPGVGKTIMAKALIEASGRSSFTLRKRYNSADFTIDIRSIFDKAIKNEPSIVFLDDIDKFSNVDRYRKNEEEYVIVQSCIEEIKEKDVFVIATANDISDMPDSLIRNGRFDRRIEIGIPDRDDVEEIIAHYLKDKKTVDDVDVKMIASIMTRKSCADLETLINEAGLYAGYKKSDTIKMEHFIDAILKTIYSVPVYHKYGDSRTISSFDKSNEMTLAPHDKNQKSFSRAVYHEAGHVLVSEMLCPGSVTMAYVYMTEGVGRGFVNVSKSKNTEGRYWCECKIMIDLAGAAAEEKTFGETGFGCFDDFDKAFSSVSFLFNNCCAGGFELYDSVHISCDQQRDIRSHVLSSEIERYYGKVKKLIALNKEFFEKIAEKLADKRLLTMEDIKGIRSECDVVTINI